MKVLQIDEEVWSRYASDNGFLGYYIGEKPGKHPWAMFVNNRCHVKLVKLMGSTWFEPLVDYK